MKLFCKKRGNLVEIVLSPFFILLIIFTLVFLPLLSYINSVAESSYFEREYLVRDVSLLIESFKAAPYNAEIEYKDTFGLNLSLSPYKILAYSYDTNPVRSPSKVSGYNLFQGSALVEDRNFSARVEYVKGREPIIYPYVFTLVKSGAAIRTKRDYELSKPISDGTFCRLIKTTIPDWRTQQKISVIVKTSQSDPKDSILGDSICTGLVLKEKNIMPSQEGCEIGSNTKSSCLDSDLVVVIYVSNKIDDEVDVYYFHNDDSENAVKSQKLGCLVLGEMTTVNLYSNVGKGLNDIPKGLIFTQDENECLKNKPVLILDVGNAEFLKTKNIASISEAIYGAIEYYYGS